MKKKVGYFIVIALMIGAFLLLVTAVSTVKIQYSSPAPSGSEKLSPDVVKQMNEGAEPIAVVIQVEPQVTEDKKSALTKHGFSIRSVLGNNVYSSGAIEAIQNVAGLEWVILVYLDKAYQNIAL